MKTILAFLLSLTIALVLPNPIWAHGGGGVAAAAVVVLAVVVATAAIVAGSGGVLESPGWYAMSLGKQRNA